MKSDFFNEGVIIFMLVKKIYNKDNYVDSHFQVKSNLKWFNFPINFLDD